MLARRFGAASKRRKEVAWHYTRAQMLLRTAELRHMRDEAVERNARLTVRQLDKMIAAAEIGLRELIEREGALAV